MYVTFLLNSNYFKKCRIHGLHDEVKDKPFELEMSWICKESGRKHTFVPPEILAEANEAGIKAKQENDDSDDD